MSPRREAWRSLEEVLADLERTDPDVAAARERYDDMVDRQLGRNGKLSHEQIRAIYAEPEDA